MPDPEPKNLVATIHFLGWPDPELEERICNALQTHQTLGLGRAVISVEVREGAPTDGPTTCWSGLLPANGPRVRG